MWGSTIPYVYYGFYCSPSLQQTYYTLISILAAGCVYATLHPAFRRSKYRPYRALMYAGLGLSFVIPIIHGITKFGWETQMWRMSLDWMALMTTFNFTGGALYAMRVSDSQWKERGWAIRRLIRLQVPEKWYPYRFDVWGSSHQIMHCLVVCAGIAHLFGLLRAFYHIHGHGDISAK